MIIRFARLENFFSLMAQIEPNIQYGILIKTLIPSIMKLLISTIIFSFSFTLLLAQGKIGMGTQTPARLVHIYDTLNTGFPFLIESKNVSNMVMELNSNAAGSAIGIGMYRNGAGKALSYVNANNNYALNMGTADNFVITPAGNIGIGQTSPGFPLNFASNLGDKIALYGNAGATYGFGIQSNQLQVHTDGAGSDVVFGYGSSAAFVERMRIKGNGFVGIGTNGPFEQLHIYDTANTGYPLFVESNNAAASMVAVDSRNNTSGIGMSYYRGAPAAYKGATYLNPTNDFQVDLASVGNIIFGKNSNGFIGLGTSSPQQNLSVNNGMNIDQSNSNAGTTSNSLTFGGGSGEGLGSKRTAGGNQYGLDFYTNFTNRMSVTSGGLVGIGTTAPGARLQINQAGTWTNSEGQTNALEIWDNQETLYMGADEANNLSYIQSVGNGFVHSLTLNPRSGFVGVGKYNPTAPLDVAGNVKTSGDLFVQTDKAIVRTNSSTPQKIITFSGPWNSTISAGAVQSGVINFETFSAIPTVYVANVVGGGVDYQKVMVTVSGVSTNSCVVNFYNPSSSAINVNATFSFVAIGPQ